MKRTALAGIAGIMLLAGTAVEVAAQDRGVNGLVLGAGSGAVLGQAIGRDTEATLLGTAVGGVLGYIIGNEMDKQARPVVAGPSGTVVIEPGWNGSPGGRYDGYGSRRPQRWQQRPECRETEILAMVDGRPEVVVTTACRDRYGEWRLESGEQVNVSQVVVVEDGDHHRRVRQHGPPPGRGWRRSGWR